jgi:primase-polymerase (primpol)-like protein
MTGERLAGTPREINERSGSLRRVYERFIADESIDDQTFAGSEIATGRVGLNIDPPDNKALDDDTLLEKAHAAENGEKFAQLWRGDTAGYESNSKADVAPCCLFTFWTGRDPGRVDEVFHRSGLLRTK